MRKACLALAAVLLAGSAQAQSAGRSELMTSVPASAKTVTDWYKQDIYDPSNTNIGKIDDVLLSDGGQVNALMVGVGGFLGAGEKDVAVPFSAVKKVTKDNKTYLTMNTTKDALKSAPGFKYDRNKTAWVPDTGK
jgi:sporulation protein YlmC with PRC-barrel domain